MLLLINVDKKIYYHINTGDVLEVGNIIDTRKSYNKFYDEIYDSEYLLNGIDANMLLINKRRNKEYGNFDMDEFRLIFETVSNSAMVTRELIFEEVRKEINEELPSRMKCLYVCENMEEINGWLEIFKRTNKKDKDYQIVKLELTGKCVTCDASYVLRQNISLNKKRDQAKKYWSGEVKDNEKEVLFEGIAVVKEIIYSNK